MDDPFKTFDEIRSAYLRYLDSPFRLRYDTLRDERRALFDRDRQLYRLPLFEPIVPYESSGLSIHDACARLGVSAQAADFMSRRLFPGARTLYRHQYDAWEASRKGQAVVVTTGTNSGKTETFLIPVFAYLVEESARWPAPGPAAPPWWAGGGGRAPQRAHEGAARQPAMRALFLYPLNALIEDQLGRIRDACNGASPQQWMTDNRPSQRFWFGRYTGATPVAGLPSNDNKRTELRRRLRLMQREWTRAVASAASRGNDRVLTYFQDPTGSEMWSRWDMQDDPPDILITNYSMLNIMLMRGVEEAVFDRTRAWLRSDPENLFHLVVDELHSYRGTPGTEVGYLLRALLERLGLTPDSAQLRIIATSASMEDDPASRDYLQQFFGRDPAAFTVVTGDRRHFPPSGGIAGRVHHFRQLGSPTGFESEIAVGILTGREGTGDDAPALLAAHLSDSGALEAVRQAGGTGPFTVDELAARAFGSADPDEVAAAKGLVRCLAAARSSDDSAPLPLRVHYFFHNAGRLWACVNPDCTGHFGQTGPGAEAPPVGRLFVEPRPRCDFCQASVLELLYCQPCGDVFLGGFQKPDPDSPNALFLCPDYPDLDRVPDRSSSLKRSAGEYVVFWPSSGRGLAQTTHVTGPQWRWQQNGQPGWRWAPARLDHDSARLTRPPRTLPSAPGRSAGFAFSSPDPEANAFPSKCAHCGADWGRRRVGSPIRDLGSGFQRVVQLLCDAMMRELEPDNRKLVLFSDSRSDAAKLSTGIKLSHHLDALRQIAYEVLAAEGSAAAADYVEALAVHRGAVVLSTLEQRQMTAPPLSAEDIAQRQKLLAGLPPEVSGEVMRHAVVGGDLPVALIAPTPPGGFASARFTELLDAARARLLDVGMNPGGPQPSVTKYRPRTRRARTVWWDTLFDWQAVPRAYRAGLQPVDQQLLDQIESSLRRSVIQDVLFADGSRDFESLNLGFLWVDASGPVTVADQTAAAVIRMLAQRRRWAGSDVDGQPQAPMYIQNYVNAVAGRAGVNPIDLHNDVVARLGSRLNQWLVAQEPMFVLAPRPDATQSIGVHECQRCGRSHLHPAGGVCTTCLRPMPPAPSLRRVDAPPEDFYEWLSRSGTPVFRLRCEELTGQTNTEDRIARQRRFQEVFLDEEFPPAAGVDLLSVTTTMEAGVDIGSLQVISLANMPPVRFNYQQRVGRAGRRGLGTSGVLTLCRGRSHDDYYFERPALITAEPPPTPYVDVSRPEIAGRVINKEVLRQAFRGVPVPVGGDNVHGEFDQVDQWAIHRPIVDAWIQGHAAEIDAMCQAVLRRTAMEGPTQRAAIARAVRTRLVAEIDDVVAHPESAGHFPLSERLASLGVLPMFGFPTRVRNLYHDWPTLTHGWPPDRGVIDRQLDIAISQFAPGAQTVKDDELHTSIGVVDYRPYGGTVVAAPDPLGPPVEVGVCRRCQALVPDPAAQGSCPYCSAARGDFGYRTVELSEPRGFTTWFSIQAEFTGGFEFTPRALRARIGSSRNVSTAARNFTVGAAPQRVYRVNDNDGADFIFRKMANQDVWFTESAFNQALQDLSLAERRAISSPNLDPGEGPARRALAAIANTDVLTTGIADFPVGLCLNPAVPDARAAWYSFGFLVRRAAAVSLDVAESELDLGIQPIMDFSSPFAPPSARVFLSDALENGAGYCTHLGDPARFEALLEFMTGSGSPPDESFWRPLVDSPHEDECASSCHRCLREFGNMAYHPLLDWRTGLDMARLALDSDAQIDLDYPYWSTLLARVAGAYVAGLGMTLDRLGTLVAAVDPVRRHALALVHPLWDRDPSNYRSDVAAAIAEGERRGLHVDLRSVLRVVRIPYE